MHQHGVSVIYVIPAMILLIVAMRSPNRKVILVAGVLVALATCFFALQGAIEDNNNGGLLAIGGFVGACAITYLVRRAGRTK